MRWDDVNARARGLGTHLIAPADLEGLAAVKSWEEFLRRLAEHGYPLSPDAPAANADEFDRHVGNVTAERLALLSRWLGPRQGAVGVILELEERQSVRALLRGVVQGMSPGGRLHAVTPTPALPRPALERLATASSPADLAKQLVRLGHPVGRALEVALVHPTAPGLLGLELAISRTFAARAVRAARHGGRVLRAFTAGAIDLENAWTLLQVPAWGTDLKAEDAWLPWGHALPLARFAELAAGDPAAVRTGLASAFAGSPLGVAFAAEGGKESDFERRALAAQIAWCTALARLQPLGPARVLLVLCRIRAEAHDLRSVAWGVALAAPADELGSSLASRE